MKFLWPALAAALLLAGCGGQPGGTGANPAAGLSCTAIEPQMKTIETDAKAVCKAKPKTPDCDRALANWQAAIARSESCYFEKIKKK